MPDALPEEIDAFRQRMSQLVNDGMLALMASIGHRTRLFDTLDGLAPSTSAEIAEAAALDERYVREWLSAMACGGIVDYEPATQRFHLPPERAAVLTRRAGSGNLAAWAPMVGFLAVVEDRIVECFRNGGGLSYDDYPGFVRAMGGQSRLLFDLALVPAILPMVPGLVERLESGIDVADVGCGAGHAVNVMAQRFPASRFTGYDVLRDAVERGRAEAAELGLTNVGFEEVDAAELDAPGAFDLVTTFTAVHDQAFPRRVLRNIARALRPDGVYLCMDVGFSSRLEDNLDHPFGPVAYTVSTMHCMSVSLGQGGEGLGEAWAGPQAFALFEEAGFTDVVLHRPEWQEGFDYYVCRTG